MIKSLDQAYTYICFDVLTLQMCRRGSTSFTSIKVTLKFVVDITQKY